MWQKYITRRLAVQMAQAWNYGWGKLMKKELGVSVTNTLTFRDTKKTDYYVDKKQHQEYEAGLYKLLKNRRFLRSFNKHAQTELERTAKTHQAELNRDLAKLSNRQLLNIYKKIIIPQNNRFYIFMWTVFNIAEPTVQAIKKQVENKIKNPVIVQKVLLQLSKPHKPNDAINQRLDLLKIAEMQNSLTDQQVSRRLANHTKKYQHIPMFDFDHEPYVLADFKKQLAAVKKPSLELYKLQQDFKKGKKQHQQAMRQIQSTPFLKDLLKFLEQNIWLRDYRDMLRQKLNLELKKFYSEAGKRIDLSVEQIVLLTNEETTNYLKTGKKFPKNKIKKRKQSFILIQKGDKVQLFSGQTAIKKSKQLLKSSQSRSKQLKGITGAPGLAQGKVKIIYTNRDLSKIKAGDILVTNMTRQDFVPVMKKVKAIITDEGGMTCHAAIIARELNIPCVVGTKNATQILKDGELVKINANKGWIIK